MQTKEWGPKLWIPLHCMTFNYNINPTDKDIMTYKTFFSVLGDILPCKYCRQSYQVYIKYLPIEGYLDSRHGVTYWLYTFHNLVNDKIFKVKPSFKDVVIQYEKLRAKCGTVSTDINAYKSCLLKFKEINLDEINEFVQIAESKYGEMTAKLVEILKHADDNPNKEADEQREHTKQVCKEFTYILKQ
ncbi:MAG: putative FAD-linked sulfhydryl oxidase [Faunusvirus sp.]|jgi:hypothetical protein|uniref:Sulfhydryl oxidase n=1 Tax=Faunusvirus sp. TaxID=2487766 RepID=A0A3G4ZVR5_9VIRU|nr:MAG: putative FAD-linked sulfhydryl oxidase [Faunusvirus sp.]